MKLAPFDRVAVILAILLSASSASADFIVRVGCYDGCGSGTLLDVCQSAGSGAHPLSVTCVEPAPLRQSGPCGDMTFCSLGDIISDEQRFSNICADSPAVYDGTVVCSGYPY
jgi:hypothetical protein